VVRAGEGSLLDRHPTGALLVIEVTSSSATVDRGVKARLYASAGVPEYWIVDVAQRAIEVHRDPDSAQGRYRTSQTLRGDDAVASTALPALGFPVARLFA
jgi:Uma2 family endonuclease